MRPVVDGLVKKYAGRYDIRVMNTSNDEQAQRLAGEMQIEYVPTFVFLNSDGSRSGQIVGSTPAEKIEAELAKLR
jgi:thioredoxin-like negative regulator of GroEL